MAGYDKMTPRSKRIGGGAVRVRDQAEKLAKAGRQFVCMDCPLEEIRPGGVGILDFDQVVGDNLNGWFHKGRVGHRVTIVQTKVCQLPACGCNGDAHA